MISPQCLARKFSTSCPVRNHADADCSHLLRNSGTFTALDFAPPPRFRNNDTASDSGSIRSNHSGVSARTNQSIRAGAYRVSRIPKEFVGTKQDLNEALKPQWTNHAL